jgi:hypothetical protein
VVRAALRRVVGRCIYGVDVNPMAAELAKVSLWIEALEPGKPLSYLDRSIRVGNSLLGVTPALLAEGLPDAAFAPIEGDDRKVASALKKQNASEREGQHDLFSQAGIPVTNAILAKRAVEIARTLPDSLEDLHIHQQRQALELAESPQLRVQKLLADAWCAAFVQPKTVITRSTAITQATLEQFGVDAGTLDLVAAEKVVQDLTRQYRFFHWHVEFPHIFRVGNGAREIDRATGWAGGFSCVIGNPPWESILFNDREFFASEAPEIANLPTAQRKQLIGNLSVSNPNLAAGYKAAVRQIKGVHHFISASGSFPMNARGMREVKGINNYKTDALFVERSRTVGEPYGRLGLIVPTGIATDAGTQFVFKDIVSSGVLISLYDFENSQPIFFGVHRSYKFCLLTIGRSRRRPGRSDFAFFLHRAAELSDERKRFGLTSEEIALLNPNTGNCPVFRSRRDAEITLEIYRRLPVLIDESDPCGNPWRISLTRMFDMSDDSHLFNTRDQLQREGWNLEGNVFAKGDRRMLPLQEGKMGHAFDHRFAEFVGVGDTDLRPVDKSVANALAFPRYWVRLEDAEREQSHRRFDCRTAFLGHRRVARSTDDRTCIAAIIPWGAASYGWIITSGPAAPDLACLAAALNSFAYDYLLRGSLTQPSIPQSTSEQIPVPTPKDLANYGHFLLARVLELTYTADDMAPYARELGDRGSPFRWDIERRSLIRAELDALFFHIYGIGPADVDYIIETFPIVKRRDVERYGFFRTKKLILDIYDAMAEALGTDKPYQTILDPLPGQGLRYPAEREP